MGGGVEDRDVGMSPLAEHQGRALLVLARRTIAQRLGQPAGFDEDVWREAEAVLAEPALQVHRGTFVTLTSNGQLRGCIGSLAAVESIADGVRHNAISAAFGDPRFGPLAGAELVGVVIEVSILSAPRSLAYTDGADLLAKLRPHVHGVILGKGAARATFLPQVWSQLPDPASFLDHLCLKALLPMDAWRCEPLDIQTYTVQYFHESC